MLAATCVMSRNGKQFASFKLSGNIKWAYQFLSRSNNSESVTGTPIQPMSRALFPSEANR